MRAIVSLNNLATSYVGIGNYKKAVELYEKSNELCNFDSRSETLDTVTFFRNIADAYMHTGDTEKAMKFHKKAFDLSKSIYEECSEKYGEKDRYTLGALYYLSLCYESLGDSAMHLELLEKCYVTGKEVFGETSVDTKTIFHSLTEARVKTKNE